jgi:hypothetical protein
MQGQDGRLLTDCDTNGDKHEQRVDNAGKEDALDYEEEAHDNLAASAGFSIARFRGRCGIRVLLLVRILVPSPVRIGIDSRKRCAVSRVLTIGWGVVQA